MSRHSQVPRIRDLIRSRRSLIHHCLSERKAVRESGNYDRRILAQKREVERKRAMLKESEEILESIRLEKQNAIAESQNREKTLLRARMELTGLKWLLTGLEGDQSKGRKNRKLLEFCSVKFVCRLVDSILRGDEELTMRMLQEMVELKKEKG